MYKKYQKQDFYNGEIYRGFHKKYEGNIKSLKWVKANDFSYKSDKKFVIYALFFSDINPSLNEKINYDGFDIPIYVGSTNDIQRRIVDHLKGIDKAFGYMPTIDLKYIRIVNYLSDMNWLKKLRTTNADDKTVEYLNNIIKSKMYVAIIDSEYPNDRYKSEQNAMFRYGAGVKGLNSIQAIGHLSKIDKLINMLKYDELNEYIMDKLYEKFNSVLIEENSERIFILPKDYSKKDIKIAIKDLKKLKKKIKK